MRASNIEIKLGSEYSVTGNNKRVAKTELELAPGDIMKAITIGGGYTREIQKIKIVKKLGKAHGLNIYSYDFIEIFQSVK